MKKEVFQLKYNSQIPAFFHVKRETIFLEISFGFCFLTTLHPFQIL